MIWFSKKMKGGFDVYVQLRFFYMKYFLHFIAVIYIVVVQFASAHTFPECPKQDEQIRIKKNSILYLKSYLDDPDLML